MSSEIICHGGHFLALVSLISTVRREILTRPLFQHDLSPWFQYTKVDHSDSDNSTAALSRGFRTGTVSL